jgi:hypothetical protein
MQEIDKFKAQLVAEEFIENLAPGFAYPIVPTDDDGNPQDFEPGCVPWVVCTGVSIDMTSVENEELTENGDLEVLVNATLTWVGGEDEDEEETEHESDPIFMVTVGWDKDELVAKDWERVD